jgi:hypothetical protein
VPSSAFRELAPNPLKGAIHLAYKKYLWHNPKCQSIAIFLIISGFSFLQPSAFCLSAFKKSLSMILKFDFYFFKFV